MNLQNFGAGIAAHLAHHRSVGHHLQGVYLEKHGHSEVDAHPDDAEQQRQRQNPRVRIARSGERAHRPEGDGAHLIVDEGQDQVDDAGNEHRKNHADEDDAVRGQRMIQRLRNR